MAEKIALTGVKSTGNPHIGNYLGAIKPALEMQQTHQSFLFIADLHALNVVPKAKVLKEDTYRVAATWLALGLDPEKTVLWRQSSVPEVLELMWVLATFTPFGLLARAHSYKDAVAKSKEVNAGVFNYPLLMAADILLYSAKDVPVGKDQKQHVEIARDIAVRFNNAFGDILTIPTPIIKNDTALVVGTDGRKMSKSYDNYIPIFEDPKKLRKTVMKIVTDSKGLEDVKTPETCNIFSLYSLFATQEQCQALADQYRQGGFGYGHAKQALFEKLEETFAPARERYRHFMQNQDELDVILEAGCERARARCTPLMASIRKAVGLV